MQTLKDSGLRGMGGAGFPTGQKWELVRSTQPGDVKYAICNADESEPGTFKDRQILATQPHLVLEGLLLGMAVVGAEQGWVFIRHEYGPEEHVLRAELDALRAAGVVGPDACGSGRRLDVEVFVSPGGYILGEETALLECMEGHRGEPRNKPPFPGNYGLHGRPTLINSVETFADVPVIVQRGAQWWADQGAGDSVGWKFFAVSGHVERPDVYCVPMGTTVRELIELAGGVSGGREVGAVQPGGASSNFIGPDKLDMPLDFGAAAENGTMLGSGAMVVLAEGTDLLAASTNVLRFFRNESCGKCVPCRVGSTKAHAILRDVVESGAELDDDRRAHIVRLEEAMRKTSICGLGQVALGPVRERARAEQGRCRRPGAAPPGRRRRPAGPVSELASEPSGTASREFFTARTVGEALAGFRPARRTAVEDVELAEALHRVPAADVRAPAAMPGFARSTVDGYAVRAADTYGASEGLPSYLDLAGAVRMGAAPTVAVSHGKCVAIPTGAVLPDGADAVVMVEYTAETMPGTIEVTRPVAPGSGLVRADEDAAAGDVLVSAGRPLRAPQLGFLAAAGVTAVAVHARPRVAIVSTGDEVVPPETADARRRPGARRDRVRAGRAGPRRRRGAGDGRDRPGRPGGPGDDAACRARRRRPGGRLGRVLGRRPRRDRRGGRRARRDLVPRAGRQARQADAAGRVRRRAAARAARQPAVRAGGVPAGRGAAGVAAGGLPSASRRSRPCAPGSSRDLASATGRLDVVQVAVRDGVAEPLFGPSALLSVLARADGYLVVPEPATGLDGGTEVEVILYR